MTEIDRELNTIAEKMLVIMNERPQQMRAAMLLRIVSDAFAAGKQAGREETFCSRERVKGR